jgi:uncharacterized protein YndB with AHSA1/START domain
MIASNTRSDETFDVSTPSATEVRMTRIFDAPRELVFEAMTKPEHVKEWWGRLGDGYSVPVCEIDLRVGGKWRFVNRHPKGEVTFYGEYREIALPDRLVFTEIFADFPNNVSVVTAVFSEVGKKTRMVVTVDYGTQEVRDIVLGTGMAKGAATSYDRLNDLVRKLAARPSA